MNENVPHVFNYDSNKSVRITEIDGEVWFVAKDVCDILEIADAHTAIRELDEDEKGWHSMPIPVGMQNVPVLSESGVYAIVFKSRKPEAKQSSRWV